MAVMLVFCQNGGPIEGPSWRPAKMLTIWYCRPLGQIWCFWKNLNQTVPSLP